MKNRLCVITGAVGGIGIETVKKFYDKDYFVVMLDIDNEIVRNRINDLRFDKNKVDYFPLDITNEEQVKITIDKIIDKYGRIDSLINIAGICGQYNMTTDYTFENFKKIYEINVFGTFLMMKYVLPIMCKQRGGNIVNFGSCSGMRGYTLEIGYGSSKWAVIGMTQNVASEYGQFGIRVNSVSPGWVDTEMMRKTLNNYGELSKANTETTINYGAIKRPVKPSEIADAVYYLCSDEATYITGTNLVIDGGKTIA